MSKKAGAKDNFRIVVEPRSLTNFGYVSASRGLIYGYGTEGQARWEREMQERCEELIADMKRHVDNFGSAYVEFDQEHVCEHCGSTWTESSSAYNGGCCEADQEAEDARLSATGEQA